MTINVENVLFSLSELDSGSQERDEITLQKKDNISSLNDRFYRYFSLIVGRPFFFLGRRRAVDVRTKIYIFM
jgi:hypothetical protein